MKVRIVYPRETPRAKVEMCTYMEIHTLHPTTSLPKVGVTNEAIILVVTGNLGGWGG